MPITLLIEGEEEVEELKEAEWCPVTRVWEDEVFKEVDDHWICLTRAVGAEHLKVEAMPLPPTDHKFEKEFADEELRLAGFGILMPFVHRFGVIGNAIKGEAEASVTLTADGSDSLHLEIEVPMCAFPMKYKLPLERVSLGSTDKVVAALRIQLAAALLREEQKTEALKQAETERDAAKAEGDSLRERLSKCQCGKAAAIKKTPTASSSAMSIAKPSAEYTFDLLTYGGKVDARRFKVSGTRKKATSRGGCWPIIVLTPSLRSDSGGSHQIVFRVDKVMGLMSVGVTDDLQWTGRLFDIKGNVWKGPAVVAKDQNFGGWQPGEHVTVWLDLDRHKLGIRALRGEFTVDWKPRPSNRAWFLIAACGNGTAVSIVD